MQTSPRRPRALSTRLHFLYYPLILFSCTAIACSSGGEDQPLGRGQQPLEGGGQAGGGNLAPIRTIQDRYPVFYDLAVDPENDLVVASDTNRFSLRTYERARDWGDLVAEPLTIISGPISGLDFVCGIDMDPVAREIFVVENDTGATLSVFDYDASGDASPLRSLNAAGRGLWGVSVDRIHDEVAVTVEHENRVSIHRRTAQGEDEPLRTIQGPNTRLTDPHGVFLDGKNNEIFVANHDSFNDVLDRSGASTGKFNPFSITVYSSQADGDVKPLRVIEGPATQLELPMKIHLDTGNNELAVANGDDSILIFSRTANGNVAPLRKVGGPATGLLNPTGVYLDSKNDELWVANPGDHSLKVFSRTADGDVPPIRVVRGSPVGVPAVGIGNPGGIAYDSIRDQILVPN